MGELDFTVVAAAVVAAAIAVSSETMLLAAAAAATGLGTCRTQCGDVSVPFPFGLSPGCHLPGFDLTCDTSHTPPRLLIGNSTLQVTDISLDNATMRVLGPDIHTDVVGPGLPEAWGSWDVGPLGFGPYVLSESQNVRLLSGCDMLVELLLPVEGVNVISSCGSVCSSNGVPADEVQAILCRSSPPASNRGGQRCNRCSGIGCCKAPIAVGCNYYDVRVTGRTGISFNHSVLIAEEAWFDHLNVTLSMALPEAEKARIPVVLAWAIVGSDPALQGQGPADQPRDGNVTCPDKEMGCHSSFSSCARVARPNCDYNS